MTDPYLYPGTQVLRNRLNIKDGARLDSLERQLVIQRVDEGIPVGDFDLAHLCSIHRHLFQDIYDWAGELRTVELSKGGSQFMFRRFIETGMADVHRRVVAAEYLQDLSKNAFAEAAGEVLGDVNHVHPFREGNGRTQLYYLEQLADRAAHPIELRKLDPAQWIKASKAANLANYTPMAQAIRKAFR